MKKDTIHFDAAELELQDAIKKLQTHGELLTLKQLILIIGSIRVKILLTIGSAMMAIAVAGFTVGQTVPNLLNLILTKDVAKAGGEAPKPANPTFEDMLLQDGGRFEWQWAGQNWIGNVEFQRDPKNEITVSLEVNKVFKGAKGVDVMKTLQPGKVVLSSDHIEISDLKVYKKDFEFVPIGSDRSTEDIVQKTTSNQFLSIANLRPVIAFAGQVKYLRLENGREDRVVNEGTGDIVLVRYSSGTRF